MINKNKISRRSFMLGLAVAGASEAATPLINLDQKQPSLINFSRSKGFFDDVHNSSFLNERGLYFDPEPELTDYENKTFSIKHKLPYRPKRDFDLVLVNSNTSEKTIQKIRQNSFDHGMNYNKFDHFLRDWRENKTIQMNRRVIDILLEISEKALNSKSEVTIHITSGYRTKKTNAYLRRLSKGVARNSLHMKGQAIDFAILDMSSDNLKNVAKEYAVGGLGVYDNFIHIDSGPYRRWAS